MEILTIVADIVDGHEDALRVLLDAINRKPRRLFKAFTALHFASFVVFDAKTLGEAPAKLVFDFTVDDGQAEKFVARCENNPTIQRIFGHCVGYRPLTGYLWTHKKRPQLYHIGTPYRTVASIRADRALRLRMERRLFVSHRLTELLSQRPGGMLEYWTWEELQPWLALIAGALGVVAAIAPPIAAPLQRPDTTWLVKLTLGLIDVGLVVAGIGGALALWSTAMPMMRARVKAWIPWFAAAALVGVGAVLLWTYHHPLRSIALGSSFVILFVLAVAAALDKRRNERLAEIRPADDTQTIVREWNRLLRVHGTGDPGPSWWRVAWNFRWWYGSYAVVAGGLWLANREGGRLATVLALTALFFGEAVWLNVLVGWPADGPWFGFSGEGAAVIAAVTVGATVFYTALTALPLAQGWLALIVLGTIFALWTVPLKSPLQKPPPLRRTTTVPLTDLEDRDVQNHMTACVVLKDSHRPIGVLRIFVLKTFLAINNSIFFRAWLPDVCKGKLFMLPTVHAAQWLVLDRRNYLFLSNYDLSWTTYLDDFGALLTSGIQKIWGQGAANPGMSSLAGFKDFARSTMVPWSLWYQAYPGLTVRQIWNNEHLRREVIAGAEEEAIARVIRRFGAAPTIPDDLVMHARVN